MRCFCRASRRFCRRTTLGSAGDCAVLELTCRKAASLSFEGRGSRRWSSGIAAGKLEGECLSNSCWRRSFSASFACGFMGFGISLMRNGLHRLGRAFFWRRFGFLEQALEIIAWTLLLHFDTSFGIDFCLIEGHIAFEIGAFAFLALLLLNFLLFLFHLVALELEDFIVYGLDESLRDNS